MANVKNITDLPLAESAEGLNLIVNDGGFAKQIAASAVGAQADFNVTDENNPAYIKNKPLVAQADWAETDENSPAFVKNKPGVAQSDWNETDESKASFIKNRPFYDTREFGAIEITFDGNIENKENVNLGEGFYIVKVSDKTPTKEEIIGSTISMNRSGEISTLELNENYIQIMGDLLLGPEGAFLIAYTDCSFMGLPFTKGLWFGTMGSEGHTVSLSWHGAVSGELKQIDSKCIKDMYYTEKIVNGEVLAEITKTPEGLEEGANVTNIYIEEPMATLVENGIYTVTWNGVEYQCLGFNDEGELILYPEEDSDIFVIYQHPDMKDDGFNAIVEVHDGSESVTMSILGTWDKIHKIDQKYIPKEGKNTFADGEGAHAEGSWTQAFGEGAHAEGVGTVANGAGTHAEGNWTGAFGVNAHAEGYETTASGEYAHTEGYQTKASDSYSHAEGYKTEASGAYAHAEGNETKAGRLAHAEGMKTSAFGLCAHAEGDSTNASSTGAHAEGGSTTASGNYSHAEGYKGTASGGYAHAEGYQTAASKNYSHAEGNATTASGEGAHVEGGNAKASGDYSHAEGWWATASGYASHAEGSITTASEQCAHAEGDSTTASGRNSHTEGKVTKASGENSHAEGYFTMASSNNQHVQGAYNIEDANNKYAHIVGNGTTEDARSNAHTLDWSGNAWYAGTVECTGIILTSPNGTKYQISVADDGTLSANAMPL